MYQQTFVLPKGLIGRFAIVKLWPEIKAAEDENIARFKITAKRLGLECVEINPEGYVIGASGIKINNENCDFAIHLHFETPKIYDLFSFVALWNPVQFFHDWGYERFSRIILTHDDFISCGSKAADDHVRRLIRNDIYHLPPKFTLNHTLSEPIFSPSSKPSSIFYAGINWEKLGKGKSRHQELLSLLDDTGKLAIYGPRIFQGVNVWEDYKSYKNEIPFDGVSMIKRISECGISLVLSSDAHKKSSLMSNRLFESAAAGAVIICDENPYAYNIFGDSLLYIDTRKPVDEQFRCILDHFTWIINNPSDAQQLAQKSQKIFLNDLTLDKQLSNLYLGLPSRKNELKSKTNTHLVKPSVNIHVFFLIDTIDKNHLENLVGSINNQTYRNFSISLVPLKQDSLDLKNLLSYFIDKSGTHINLINIFEQPPGSRRKIEPAEFSLGNVLFRCLKTITSDIDGILFVGPNESIQSNHLEVLVNKYRKEPSNSVFITSCLLLHSDGTKVYHDINDEINILNYQSNRPNGLARTLINARRLPDDLDCVLPYLNRMAICAFFSIPMNIDFTPITTCTIDIRQEFPNSICDINLNYEIKTLKDYLLTSHFSCTSFNLNSEPLVVDEDSPSDDQKFIISSYQCMLNRTPSEEEICFYISRLKQFGKSRVLRDIIVSQESAKINNIPNSLRTFAKLVWKK